MLLSYHLLRNSRKPGEAGATICHIHMLLEMGYPRSGIVMEREMRQMLRITAVFLMSFAAAALASQQVSAGEEPGHSMPTSSRPANSTLAVGVTLDGSGRLWLARVEDQQLLVS